MRGRYAATIIASVMLLSVMACGRTEKSEFTAFQVGEKILLVSAENAEKGVFLTTDPIRIEKGELVDISADLEGGEIRIEMIRVPEGLDTGNTADSGEGETVITVNLHKTDRTSGTVTEGTYIVKATCLEKATGQIRIGAGPEL